MRTRVKSNVNGSGFDFLTILAAGVVIFSSGIVILNQAESRERVLGQTAPTSGYARMMVAAGGRKYTVVLVAADLNTTRVVVDTAAEGDCRDNCPVLPLVEFVKRNGAVAGINGSYFCAATYSSCSSNKNAFDTLLMNRNKRYFNSDNNVYSQVPAVIFYGNSARFVKTTAEWGRDTGVDAVLANYPLLVFNNAVNYWGSNDSKLTGRGARGFVGATGSTAYIGIVYAATAAEAASVIHSLGIHNALNLDSGGSTALWHGGYKAGPGRNIPNAILFVRR